MIDTVAPVEVIALSAQDRCDRCGARAMCQATHPDAPSELLFCGHHMNDVSVALLEQGWTIIESVTDEV
jgi:hypothetical protein